MRTAVILPHPAGVPSGAHFDFITVTRCHVPLSSGENLPWYQPSPLRK